MREIKFRIWDKDNKKWFEPVYEAYRGNLYDLSISLDGEVITRTTKICASMLDHQKGRYDLSQFTGLTDGNGKEIYEGDIVEENGEIYEVHWKTREDGTNYTTGFYPFKGSNECCGCSDKVWGEDCRIIGNIYENLELLTENN